MTITDDSAERADQAGSSARREHERRRAKDEAAIRASWGKLGGIAVALTPERQSTTAWRTGAIGEERVGAALDALASDSIRVLHDRRIPKSSANIDHIVVIPAGVWVVNAKRYKGQRPTLRIDGGLFRPRSEYLVVGGREKSSLLTGMAKQLTVRRSVTDVPVTGALCFVDADWPMFGGSFRVDDVHVLWPNKLAQLLRSADGDVDVDAVATRLEALFRPA